MTLPQLLKDTLKYQTIMMRNEFILFTINTLTENTGLWFTINVSLFQAMQLTLLRIMKKL